MTITFIPENRKQKYLLFILGIAIIGGVGIVWYQFFREIPLTPFQTQPPAPQPVEIDFAIFEHPAFLELGDSRSPIPFPDEVGKRNPFTLNP